MKGYEKLTIGQIKDGIYKSSCPKEFGFQTKYSNTMPERDICGGDCDTCWSNEVLQEESGISITSCHDAD